MILSLWLSTLREVVWTAGITAVLEVSFHTLVQETRKKNLKVNPTNTSFQTLEQFK